MIRTWMIALVAFALVAGACGSDGASRALGEPRVAGVTTAAPSTTTPPPTTNEPRTTTTAGPAGSQATTTTTIAELALVLDGRALPTAPQSAEEAVERFVDVERAIRSDATDPDLRPDLGHHEQVIVRAISRNPEWHEFMFDEVPTDLRRVLELHLLARAELGSLHTAPPLESIPAWEIIEPEPMWTLVAYYEQAEDATGIDWEVLAAINLVETGMGRIDGLSSAGAQGPMQFLPTTWDEVSEGGDIDDPRDAIGGAARYLVQRGGLEDIRQGLYGYNNSDNYVNAVLAYADLLRLEGRALRGLYHWEIYVGTEVGTLWLPVGFRTDEPLSASAYLEQNPWVETIPG